jgi:hypothetical protein
MPDDLKNYEAPTFIGMIPPEVAGYIIFWIVALLMLLDQLGAFA